MIAHGRQCFIAVKYVKFEYEISFLLLFECDKVTTLH